MATKLKRVDLGGGIFTMQEDWLDQVTKPERAEEENERKAQKFARQLAERTAEVAMLRIHARKIAEHAVRLQNAKEQAEQQAKEADRMLEAEFQALAQQWRNETAHLSIASEKANSFAYHQIMAMGEQVLPLIFRELESKPSDWFWELRAIARDKAPEIPPEAKGRVRRMAEIWLEWGKLHGYVSG